MLLSHDRDCEYAQIWDTNRSFIMFGISQCGCRALIWGGNSHFSLSNKWTRFWLKLKLREDHWALLWGPWWEIPLFNKALTWWSLVTLLSNWWTGWVNYFWFCLEVYPFSYFRTERCTDWHIALLLLLAVKCSNCSCS